MADRSFTQDLTAGALSQTYEFPVDTHLNQITINFSVNITEEVTITLDSKYGSDYDIVLDRDELEAQPDYTFVPQNRFIITRGDILLIEVTNANATGSAFGVVNYTERNP